MSKIKVLIEVSGGNIQSITTNNQEIEFHIIDHDNLSNNPPNEEIEGIMNKYEPDQIMTETKIEKKLIETLIEYQKKKEDLYFR